MPATTRRGARSRGLQREEPEDDKHDEEQGQVVPKKSKTNTREIKVTEMISLMPKLKDVGFEEWLRKLQGVAAHCGWYDFEKDGEGEEWTPLRFETKDPATKEQRMDAWTVITQTSESYKHLWQPVPIGDAKAAYEGICSLLNRTSMGGFIEHYMKAA